MFQQFSQFLVYLKPLKWLFITALLFGMIAAAASGFGLPAMTEKVFPVVFDNSNLPPWLYDFLKNNIPQEYLKNVILIVACMGIPLIFTIRGVASFINGYLTAYVGMRVLEEIRMSAFARLQILPLSFHERQQKGDLISRLVSDAQNVQSGITQVANDLIKQPITLLTALSYMIYTAIKYDMFFTLTTNLVFVVIGFFPIYIFGKRIMKKAQTAQERMGDLNATAQENLSSQREVRSYGMQEQQIKFFAALTDQFRIAQMKAVKYRQFLIPTLEVVSAIALAFLLVRGRSIGMTKELFVSMGMALYMCYDPIKRLGVAYNRLKQAQASLDRMIYILDEPDTMPEPKEPAAVDKLHGHVIFNGVSFSYDGVNRVLNGITLDIPRGQIIGLVGPSGAGKTTFASMIPRFYDVSDGNVTIDGVDLRSMTKHQLRKNIALVSQSAALFRNTIMENIRVGKPDASDEEVMEAARKASVDEFARNMPEGYQTMLGDGGAGVSGGQRQRIAIARAFLKDAPILILDEATASLDSESELKIQDELDLLVQGRTTFIVAHRFSSIRIAERLLVFENGNIIGDGSHGELYSRCPLYKELYDKQSF